MLVYHIPTRAQDSLAIKERPADSLMVGGHKSGYNDIHVTGGSQSVDASLVADDEYKAAWLNIDMSKNWLKGYYKFKRNLKNNYNIAIGMDYMFLNQYASYSRSDRQATSGVFRVFGTWKAFDSADKNQGSLTIKIENRHKIGHKGLPRTLGYDAGSALSTASFKNFNWGLTNFFWKQLFNNTNIELLVGQMDPGDWADIYPMVSAYTYYMNEAFFSNPALALPNQGLGLVIKGSVTKNFYLWGGLHDANGEPNNFGGYIFKSFFKTHEYFTWIEAGWRPEIQLNPGQTVHLTYWHQDARTDAGTDESWGFCFSASTYWKGHFIPFIRAGISEGGAARMHHMIMIGTGINVIGHDYAGVGFSWGGPADRSKPNQYGIELFYSLQLTQHLNVTPDVQWTINPSFNPDKDHVGVYGLIRVRYAM